MENRRGHVIVVTYPAQGHINPLLQFAKRLASKGLKATLATTHYTVKSIQANSVGIEPISDGFDEDGYKQASSLEAYLESFKIVGSRTLSEVVSRFSDLGQHVCCIVYDSLLPWALDVARNFGIHAAVFMTNSASVCSLYWNANQGGLDVPFKEEALPVVMPGLPPLGFHDLPSFLAYSGTQSPYLALIMDKFAMLDQNHWALCNSFEELEPEIMDHREILIYLFGLRAYINMLIMAAAGFYYMNFILTREVEKGVLDERTLARYETRRDVIDSLTKGSDTNCIWELRMCRNTFAHLCEILRTRGGMMPKGRATVEEQVAIFLNILAHHTKNRSIQVRFCRSGETVSRNCHQVLTAILRLEHVLLAKPDPVPQDCTDERWKWFKGCLGALDGTYIAVTPPATDRPRYRTRKGHLATNVLGVCTRDLRFIYVLAGWEGSASDSRVLRDAVIRPNGLRVPTGSYYLVDGGYTNGQGFLAPFRGRRYHIQEWTVGRRAPQNREELFNYRHAKARNVIERCFGILKKRWGILRSPSFYPMKIQCRMILACCLLHNFVRMYMPLDPLEYALIEGDEVPIGEDGIDTIGTVEASAEWTQMRDNLAQEMYNEWRARHRN